MMFLPNTATTFQVAQPWDTPQASMALRLACPLAGSRRVQAMVETLHIILGMVATSKMAQLMAQAIQATSILLTAATLGTLQLRLLDIPPQYEC
jgi:conjugal transfer/entry exclusion protein